MLRHTALFLRRDTTSDAEMLMARKGLAYMSYGCPSVRAVDFGLDLFGGSERLREVKPWKRTPLWNARAEGPPTNYDMALNLDFDDAAGLDAYNDDDVHHEVGAYNASISFGEFTARVDWWYDGPPRIEREGVRHTSLFLWRDDATDAEKATVKTAFGSLSSLPMIRSLAVADNIGTLATDYDLILDVMVDGVDEAKAFLEHDGHAEALAIAASASKYEWTARITHSMGLG